MIAKCISLKRNETVWLALTIRSLFLLNVCEQGIHFQTVLCGDFLKCNKFWTVKTLEYRKFWTVKISVCRFRTRFRAIKALSWLIYEALYLGPERDLACRCS